MDIDGLYEQHYARLRAFVSKLAGNKDAAEDIVQETFAKALVNQPLFRELSEGQRRAWLFSTAKNLCMDWFRSSRFTAAEGEAELSFEEMADGDFDRLLRVLPEQLAAVVVMRYALELNSSEIAERLGVPAVTVRRRLQSARSLIKQQLEQMP